MVNQDFPEQEEQLLPRLTEEAAEEILPDTPAEAKTTGRFASGATQSHGRFESKQEAAGRFEAPATKEEAPSMEETDFPTEAAPLPAEEEAVFLNDAVSEEDSPTVEPLDPSLLEGIDLSEPVEEAPVPKQAPKEIPAPREPKKEKSAKKAPPVKKGRPRHKKGEGLFGIPNILVTAVWVALTIVIGVTLGRMVWICASDVLAFGREDKNVTITVYESDTIEQITDKLYRAELIRYPELFKLYAKFAVDDGEIHAGMWDLNTRYDYHALVRMMSPSSTREVIKVLIPEGYTCRQIFNVLEENKVCTRQDIEAYAAYGELNEYWFLENVERGDKYCLEGFLFPDTYEFYKNDSPKNILNKMLNNFNNRYDEEMRWQIDQLNAHLTDLMRANGRSDDYVAAHLFTVRDVVNVASMVERETSSAEEGHTIASVIYNRLFNWGSNPAYLNIDATIVYALGGKNDLSLEDLRVDSPYNTYLNTGLTPGPIANPGLASLKAALKPDSTDYYYYILDPAVGHHHFSRTQEEHEAFRTGLGG